MTGISVAQGFSAEFHHPAQVSEAVEGALSVPGKNLFLGEVGGDEHRTVIPLGCVYYEVEALAFLSVVVYLHLHSQFVNDGESGALEIVEPSLRPLAVA